MNVQDLETRFNNIQQAYEQGKVNHAEYVTLIKGLDLESAIKSGVKELQKKQDLYDAINKAITIVKILS
jgi:hypothetical protein